MHAAVAPPREELPQHNLRGIQPAASTTPGSLPPTLLLLLLLLLLLAPALQLLLRSAVALAAPTQRQPLAVATRIGQILRLLTWMVLLVLLPLPAVVPHRISLAPLPLLVAV